MGIILDVLILIIIGLCCRSGAKRGVAATLVSIIVFLIAMTGAGYIARDNSDGMTTTVTPFLSGLMESKGALDAQEKLGLRESDTSVNDKVAEEPTFIFDYSNACFNGLGVSGKTADKFSEVTAQYFVNGDDANEAVNKSFCEAVAYFVVVIIAFTLIIIFLSVAVELTHLKPKLKLSSDDNEYFGAIAGFFHGVVLCIGICWALSFLGIVIGRNTMQSSIISKFLLSLNYLTGIAVA